MRKNKNIHEKMLLCGVPLISIPMNIGFSSVNGKKNVLILTNKKC